MDAKVKYVVSEDRIPVAQFSCSPTDGQLRGLDFTHHQSVDGKAWLEGQSASNESVTFTSAPARVDNDPKEGMRYMIGIMAPGSSTMLLHDIARFEVASQVKDICQDLPDIEKSDKTGLQKRNTLVNTFGAAKRKRELVSQLNGQVTDEKMLNVEDAKTKIESRAKELGLSMEENSAMAAELQTMRELLPPFDLEATIPDQIYEKKAIVPEHLLQPVDGSYYSTLVQDFKKLQGAEEGAVPHSTIHRLIDDLCGRQLDSTMVRQKGKEIQVLHWLLDLYNFSFQKVSREKKEEGRKSGCNGIPNVSFMMWAFGTKSMPSRELAQYWLDIFQEPGESLKMRRKKMLAYLTVWIALLAPKHKFCFSTLMDDLHDKSDKYISTVAQYIGCEKRANGHWALKAPLKVHHVRNKKRKKN